MRIRRNVIQTLGILAIGLLCAIAGARESARAQAPAASPVQPWGLPPLPQGVGLVEKFADIHDTPQASIANQKFVEEIAVCMARVSEQYRAIVSRMASAVLVQMNGLGWSLWA